MNSGKRNGNGRLAPSREQQVLIVGAGAAGLGVAVALQHAGVKRMLLVDRHEVGASFERWPREMRFITPSFPTNSIGMLDLNAIALGTSPAFSLQVEHPTGREYAAYLRGVAEHFHLPVQTGWDVQSLDHDGRRFVVQTSHGVLRAKFVVWAAGEFQYPQHQPFPGAEFCRHNSQVASWADWPGEEAIVIGGNESGLDAAIHLVRRGHRVTILEGARTPPWKSESSDPSVSLSTFTVERLNDLDENAPLHLASSARVSRVRRWGKGYEVVCTSGRAFRTQSPPILATGFRGGASLIADRFEARDDRLPLLNEHDESTRTPGLFLVGPQVRHDQHVFCFIYKFRQRFAVVAKTIATRLSLPAEELETYRQWGMYLDDLSCCGQECVC